MATRQKNKKTTNTTKQFRSPEKRQTFLEHVHELRRRLFYIAISVGIFGTAAYFVQHQIIDLLLAPSAGQNMMSTTPGGGLDFLFRICIYTGVVFSFPVIMYQFLKYLEPLLGEHNVRFALKGSALSGVLAAAGIIFGYFAGMPAALHFLFHQFTTDQIQVMITITSYMQFVTVYMLGAALLFQVPLIMILINRIKPLTPRKLFGFERWMILCSFVLALIMNPTPNVVDQLLLAGPMILMYQVGIAIIAFVNRGQRGPARSKKILALLEEDSALQAERESRLASAKQIWTQASAVAERPTDVQTILSDATPRKKTITVLEQPSMSQHVAIRAGA